MLEDERDVALVLAPQAWGLELKKSDDSRKKILLLSSRFVAWPFAEYTMRHTLNDLATACRTLASVDSLE